jgi:Chitobiase/beta-hexosaminidase C-terminal domain
MAAQQATQQASQAAMQANQEAMRQAQQANEEAARASQRANEDAQRLARCCTPAARPKFSAQGGAYDKPVTVKVRESTRGAVVYYTTDGWTPTTASTRYTGPITISMTTTLQAIAVAPNMPRSRIASSIYTIRQSGPATVPQSSGISQAKAAAGVLPKGTVVPLVFAANYTSRKADVGDKINLTLADDLRIGDAVVVPKGTLAIVNVTEAHKAGPGGLPGLVALEAETLTVGDTSVKLEGVAAKEGREVSVNPATIGLSIVPAGLLLVHGNEAEIKQGAVLAATVAEDTKLGAPNQ